MPNDLPSPPLRKIIIYVTELVTELNHYYHQYTDVVSLPLYYEKLLVESLLEIILNRREVDLEMEKEFLMESLRAFTFALSHHTDDIELSELNDLVIEETELHFPHLLVMAEDQLNKNDAPLVKEFQETSDTLDCPYGVKLDASRLFVTIDPVILKP